MCNTNFHNTAKIPHSVAPEQNTVTAIQDLDTTHNAGRVAGTATPCETTDVAWMAAGLSSRN
jgi:hypothetical protein